VVFRWYFPHGYVVSGRAVSSVGSLYLLVIMRVRSKGPSSCRSTATGGHLSVSESDLGVENNRRKLHSKLRLGNLSLNPPPGHGYLPCTTSNPSNTYHQVCGDGR